MTPERLVFGRISPQETAFRRRSGAAREERPPSQEIYAPYRLGPLIQKILEADWNRLQENSRQRRETQQGIFKTIWGEGAKIPEYFSPSVVAHCLRWVGYEALGYKPAPPSAESHLVTMMGSAIHWSFLRVIEQQIPARQETIFAVDEADLSGRIDCLFRNPKTSEYQILEIKTVGDYPFRQIKREGLPPELRNTKDIYQPAPEHRNQVLLYMWAKRKEGLNVACANIIYINRDSGQIKEALVVWNSKAEYDAEQLVAKIRQAKEAILRKELPQPTVESSYTCAKLCPYRVHCEYGQKFAAGQIKKEQRRRPQWVYRRAREEAKRRREEMEKLGVVQAQLPGWEEALERPQSRCTSSAGKERTPPHCGDCGTPMRWNSKAARGGRYVCPNCGNS